MGGKTSPQNYSLFPSTFHKRICWTCLHLLYRHHIIIYSFVLLHLLQSSIITSHDSQSIVPGLETSALASAGNLRSGSFLALLKICKVTIFGGDVRKENWPATWVFWSGLWGIPVHTKAEPLPLGTALEVHNHLWFANPAPSLPLCHFRARWGTLSSLVFCGFVLPWFSFYLTLFLYLFHWLLPPIFWNFPHLSVASFSLSLMRI